MRLIFDRSSRNDAGGGTLIDVRWSCAATWKAGYVAMRETRAWTKRNERSMPAWLASAFASRLISSHYSIFVLVLQVMVIKSIGDGGGM